MRSAHSVCSCGAIRTINFTPIADLKAGWEGERERGREGVGGLDGYISLDTVWSVQCYLILAKGNDDGC